MRFLRNLRVGNRLAIGFGFLVVVIIAFGSFAVSRLGVTTTALERMDSLRIKKLETTTQIQQLCYQNSRAMVQLWYEQDPAKIEKWVSFMVGSVPKYFAMVNELREITESPEEKAIAEKVYHIGVQFWITRASMREFIKA